MIGQAAAERGGVTPFNLLPVSASGAGGGHWGHPASTPEPLCDWWVRYLTRPGDLILDPFFGSGTVGVAALKAGRRCIGIEAKTEYVRIARQRVRQAKRARDSRAARDSSTGR